MLQPYMRYFVNTLKSNILLHEDHSFTIVRPSSFDIMEDRIKKAEEESGIVIGAEQLSDFCSERIKEKLIKAGFEDGFYKEMETLCDIAVTEKILEYEIIHCTQRKSES